MTDELKPLAKAYVEATTAFNICLLGVASLVLKVLLLLVVLVLFVFGVFQKGLIKASEAIDQVNVRPTPPSTARCETCGGVGGHTRACSRGVSDEEVSALFYP